MLRAGRATATQYSSAQSPMLGQTCVHKSACLWLAPMQSSSSSLKACTTHRLWVGKSGGPLRLHKAMYKAQMSAISIVLCTSTTRAAMIPSNATPRCPYIIWVHWRHRPSTSSKPIDCPSEGSINSKAASETSKCCIKNYSYPSTANINGCDTRARCR